MMDEQHPRDLIAAYVLDAVNADEAADVRAHLATCSLCRRLESELRDVEALLPELAGEIEPPARLKVQLMAAITREPRRGSPAVMTPPDAPPGVLLPPRDRPGPSETGAAPRRRPSATRLYSMLAIAAVLVLAVLGVGLWTLLSGNPPGPTNRYKMVATGQLPGVHGTLGTLAYYRDDRRLELDLHGLRPLDKRHVYELWLIRGKSVVKGIMVFRAVSDGSGHLTYRGEAVPTYTLAALTVERRFTDKPTLPVVATATITT